MVKEFEPLLFQSLQIVKYHIYSASRRIVIKQVIPEMNPPCTLNGNETSSTALMRREIARRQVILGGKAKKMLTPTTLAITLIGLQIAESTLNSVAFFFDKWARPLFSASTEVNISAAEDERRSNGSSSFLSIGVLYFYNANPGSLGTKAPWLASCVSWTELSEAK
ncbi:hypothetical protein OIDMADRAFT_28316 [Oidiodendron maius Zn]|uniref:Uncharacterized protein n=1 Tax=Oidiodendron maius (strain Zn) TaxID=913774 RepID=A0A0C3HIP5_OIDMZ|nr:hypothetical protein OIDMADRAFT_28316 [Oidiodendron maius Zn]